MPAPLPKGALSIGCLLSHFRFISAACFAKRATGVRQTINLRRSCCDRLGRFDQGPSRWRPSHRHIALAGTTVSAPPISSCAVRTRRSWPVLLKKRTLGMWPLFSVVWASSSRGCCAFDLLPSNFSYWHALPGHGPGLLRIARFPDSWAAVSSASGTESSNGAANLSDRRRTDWGSLHAAHRGQTRGRFFSLRESTDCLSDSQPPATLSHGHE